MTQISSGDFNARCDAETTVEHPVQDHGPGWALLAEAEGEGNSAGTLVSGAGPADAAAGDTSEGVRQGWMIARTGAGGDLLEAALAGFRECNAADLKAGPGQGAVLGRD
ncbi:hypothetical protein [Muricoccus aerilatus]|uniref:hypothetical protein n=1 Tax=Muricoccus aerilatus TaxID=452982 RepID=UPI0005C24C4E|nr:hypothetical protein [Roseomonas aerilata]